MPLRAGFTEPKGKVIRQRQEIGHDIDNQSDQFTCSEITPYFG
jgi:hypothetical protein